jgi:glucosamine--fructose-6-phosphate aminotransferase (isomerizing)
MCGIVGYIGRREAGPFLVEGLRRLEYRGYDSAGAAFLLGNRVVLEKARGRVSDLAERLIGAGRGATTGIGHTRWATHGRPSDDNAHPHADCTARLAVVHNGIIENYRELRDQLAAGGHRFASETDTEILAHLVEDERRGDGLDNAVRRALTRLTGTFAVAVLSVDDPKVIIAARRGSPLIVGTGEGEQLLASDIPALLPFTRNQIVLEDGELAAITCDQVAVGSLAGLARGPRKPTRIDWDLETAEKAGYPHFMLKEIHEQPRAVRDTLAARLEQGLPRLPELGLEGDAARDLARVELIACGTSWHAGLVGARLIEDIAGIPARAEIASELRHRPALAAAGRSLAVAISQSGETADTVAALREVRRAGVRLLAVANVVGSTIARESDGVLLTRAGPELSVASTKAFTTQVSLLYLLAVELGLRRQTLSPDRARELCRALTGAPPAMQWILDRAPAVAGRLAPKLATLKGALFLGRGYGFPLALEGALKLKEITYLHAEGYPAGEMKHGPIALVNPETLVVGVVPRDAVRPRTLANLEEIKAREGFLVAVATEGDAEVERLADAVLWIPEAIEPVNPLLVALPLQLIAYALSVALGRDVDRPRNLAKSVTVE